MRTALFLALFMIGCNAEDETNETDALLCAAAEDIETVVPTLLRTGRGDLRTSRGHHPDVRGGLRHPLGACLYILRLTRPEM
jgi:hypothetical protein